MAVKDKKYYWLKLKKDFFKRHDIRIIEAMPNGKDYILFYLKLLCESVDHDGTLRFSESIPYNEDMLATITNTNVDIVRSAIKIFTELNMMEIMDDGTFYMLEVSKMIGSETYWAEKKREAKAKKDAQNLIGVGEFPTESNENPTCPSKSKSIEQEQEKEKELLLASKDSIFYGLFEGMDISTDEVDNLVEYLDQQSRHMKMNDPEQDRWRLFDEMSDMVMIAKERKAKYVYAFLKKVIMTTDFNRECPDYMRF